MTSFLIRRGVALLVDAPRSRVSPAFARRLGGLSWSLVLIGSVGMAFHRGAMFYRSTVSHLPGSAPLIRSVNDMGSASVAIYAVVVLTIVLSSSAGSRSTSGQRPRVART